MLTLDALEVERAEELAEAIASGEAPDKRILKTVSSNLPVPAGEGIDSIVMTKNIFHIFRILSKTDIRLVKETTINESETMELNHEMFYRWLLLGNTDSSRGPRLS